MRLNEIIRDLPFISIEGQIEPTSVKGLAYDSRKVEAGYIFFALKGSAFDGHDFLDKAASNGALAAFVETFNPQIKGLCQIVVKDTRKALSYLASLYYGLPSQKMTMVGITGTNGKTTVSYLVESVLSQNGPVGVLGTVDIRWPEFQKTASMTTPEPLEIHGLLAEMSHDKVHQAVLEVSSHALDQKRCDDLAFDVGVFTNLSRDHLDYHGDMENYFQAKKRLFTELIPHWKKFGKKGLSVVFADDPKGLELAQELRAQKHKVLTYGLDTKADVTALDLVMDIKGLKMTIKSPMGDFEIHSPLVGRFNALNILAAASVGLGLGMEPSLVAKGLSELKGVPGRLERVAVNNDGPVVFVDYCHTDDALFQALNVLRPICKGKLFCVFGAGGDRDHGKRPLMGKAVAKQADLAVLTSDNPRTEEPLSIMDMIEPGLYEGGFQKLSHFEANAQNAFVPQPDRKKAIFTAIKAAGDKDVILIAGKGHEDYQIIGHTKRHFDDRKEAAKALEQVVCVREVREIA